MQDAVLEYRKRRQKRLDAKAVEQYRQRRDERLISRFDDGEDENANNVSSKRGHGNTKIPYGLCQREGIQIDPKWSPKDAWEALAGKGYKAGDVYKELKETGKIGLKKVKKALTKLVETHFPAGMLGSSKKNTMEFANYINEHCEDADISEFLSLGNSPKAKTVSDFKCKKTKATGKSEVKAWWYVSTGNLARVVVTIPQLTGIKDASEKAAKVRTFAHEWTHYIDLVSRDKNKTYFTETFSKLNDAISSSNTASIGEKVQKTFDDFNAKYDAEIKKRDEKAKAAPKQVMNEMFGDDRPNWLDENGGIHHLKLTSRDIGLAEDYRKRCKNRISEIEEEARTRCRAMSDGVDSLQGLYDSLCLGGHRASGKTKYGHSLDYFKYKGNRPIEALADYVALRATNPKIADMFRNDKPEIAKAMDETIEAIIKQLKE